MRFLPAFLLIFILSNSSAEEVFTTAEQEAIHKVLAKNQSDCEESFARMASRDRTPAAMQKWVNAFLDPHEYCTCGTKAISTLLTPEVVHSRKDIGGEAIGRKIGLQCMLPRLKENFPEACRQMFSDLSEGKTQREGFEKDVTDFCRCAGLDMDALTVETAMPYLLATLQDFSEFKRSRQLPPEGRPSLIARFNQCGVFSLRDGVK